MPPIESTLRGLGGLDTLAAGSTPVHRRDPRAKLLVALAFILTVVSYGKYDLAGLLPLLIYPVALMALAGLPARALLIRLLPAIPFILLLGAFNPLLDRAPLLRLGAVELSGGWVSLASLLLRAFLTLTAALILVATTGMNAVCAALTRLGVPRVFAVQLQLLYRYLWVLADEAARTLRAFALRSGGRRVPLGVFGSLAGGLLLRALDRAERLHVAMLCRGFDGEFRLARPLRFGRADLLFVLGWTAFFLAVRLVHLPRLLGQFILEVAR